MSTLRKNYGKIVRAKGKYLSRPMTIDGSENASSNMAVNGSVTSVPFWIQPDVNEKIEIRTVNLIIGNGASTSLQNYGNIIGPLTNGIQFFSERQGEYKLLNGSFRSNSDLLRIASRGQFIGLEAGGRLIIHIENFDEYSDPLILRGDTNDKFGVLVRDNLTSLVTHACQCKGGSYEVL